MEQNYEFVLAEARKLTQDQQMQLIQDVARNLTPADTQVLIRTILDEKQLITDSEMVIRALQEITSDHAQGFEAQVRRLLLLGCQRFDLEIGILSQITDNHYEVVNVVAPAYLGLKPYDTFDLGSTYCVMTLDAAGPIGFEHVGASCISTHPAYQAFGLEAYIGTPVKVRGMVYGTLNFSSPYPRQRTFNVVDIDALELMASWVSSELYRQQLEQADETRQ